MDFAAAEESWEADGRKKKNAEQLWFDGNIRQTAVGRLPHLSMPFVVPRPFDG